MLKVKIGDELLAVRGRSDYRTVKVTRVTKTQCTTDDGARWSLRTGRRRGLLEWLECDDYYRRRLLGGSNEPNL